MLSSVSENAFALSPTTASCVVAAVAKTAESLTSTTPETPLTFRQKFRKFVSPTRTESPLDQGSTILRPAPERGSAYYLGIVGARTVVQEPIRMITKKIYGVPHELHLVDGAWLALERRLLPKGKVLNGPTKFVLTTTTGLVSMEVAGYFGIPHPWDYHLLNFVIEDVESLKNKRELKQQIENNYRYAHIRELLQSGKIKEKAALRNAEALRQGFQDLNAWQSRLKEMQNEGTQFKPEEAVADLFAPVLKNADLMKLDPKKVEEELAFRSLPVDHIKQFLQGDWRRNRGFRATQRTRANFNKEQVLTLVDLEFDKIVAQEKYAQLLIGRGMIETTVQGVTQKVGQLTGLGGEDISQAKLRHRVVQDIEKDPFFQILSKNKEKLSPTRLRYLAMEDVDWQYRFAQARILGIAIVDPTNRRNALTLEGVRHAILKREGLVK